MTAFGNCVHLCIDMQRMFLEATDWQVPAMAGVLPAIEAIAGPHADRTIFTRFLPPPSDQANGAWQEYYAAWPAMARERLAPELVELAPVLARLVPPARSFDKPVFSPWWSGQLHNSLQAAGVDTLVVTGGETEVCVLAAVMGAIDLGYRIVLPTDALCSSAQDCHDAMLSIYGSRFGVHLMACTTQDVLDMWREAA